jgi:hypothetical protein
MGLRLMQMIEAAQETLPTPQPQIKSRHCARQAGIIIIEPDRKGFGVHTKEPREPHGASQAFRRNTGCREHPVKRMGRGAQLAAGLGRTRAQVVGDATKP